MMFFKSATLFLASCLSVLSLSAQVLSEDLTRYVDPLIGTKEMGHVFPGACVPFGMVQLSPDTDTIPYAVNGKYTPERFTVIVPDTSTTTRPSSVLPIPI